MILPSDQEFMNRFNTPGPAGDEKTEKQIFTVSQLNRSARQVLEMHFNQVWVEGEISNFARPSSGHWYFSLKDDSGQVRCAMFRGQNFKVRFAPEAGMQVRVRAKLSIYEGRGDYQLIVEHMEEAGIGALQQAFEALKKQLAQEGLFDEAHKQPLPDIPRQIAVVTSPTGAALHDILHVLKRRFPLATVTLIPTAVQGKEAPAQIVEAIQQANSAKAFDVMVVGRGGGSLEDLWAFNNEQVARAIFASDLPVISAVGHEVDFSISDFVADVRAPTPSAAAEICTPDQRELMNTVQQYQDYFQGQMEYLLESYSDRLFHLNKRIKHPGQVLREQAQQLDHLELRMQQHVQFSLQHQQNRHQQLTLRLKHLSPEHKVQQAAAKLLELVKALPQQVQQLLKQKQQQLQHSSQLLNSVSPLNVLNRGYSILSTPEGKVVSDSAQIKTGDKVSARLHRGNIEMEVLKTSSKKT